MAVAAAFTVKAQTPLQARMAARPLTQDDIGAYKLPTALQRSGGLFTTGVGQPWYLETQINIAVPASDITSVTWELTTRPDKSAAALVDSPLGAAVPVFEPSDRLAYQIAGRKMLRPDVTGLYVVTANVTTASNGKAEIAQTFIAANYVGIQACNGCHSGGLAQNMSETWSKTAHNQLFKQGIEGVQGSHYSAACISCHTVGFDTDPAAVNGGFDDVAKQLNWTFPAVVQPGNWDAMPDALKNLANIQCENCHGPGSVHANSGGALIAISKPDTSGACASCHAAATHHIKPAEWNNSRHAITTRDPSGAGRAGCVGCHTSTGYQDRLNGVTSTNLDYSAITCQTCHEPHGQTKPSTNLHLVRNLEAVTLQDGTLVTNAGMGTICMDCHQSRRNAATYAATTAASSHFGPHDGTQADMLEGVNAFTYGQTLPTGAHGAIIADTCVTCHAQTVDATDPAFTQVGGHTFKMAWPGDATNPPKQLVGACQSCHGKGLTTFDFPLFDFNNDGKIEGVQTEVQRLLDELALQLPPVGQVKTALNIDSTWTRAQLEAGYNWQFVKSDGSLGIHNLPYAVSLLQASIADVKAANAAAGATH